MVTPFYLVPDEDRGQDSDDLTAQVHLGTSDIPDILGVGVGGVSQWKDFVRRCSC